MAVTRQVTPPDPDLAFAAPVAPVVQPRRRAPIERAPIEMEPAPAPVVTPAARVEAPSILPDLGPPRAADGTLWAAPAPTFTYLAGPAGSGKTFATREWAEKEPGLVLCATTGIAAINLGGETINSVLGYFDTASLQEAYITGFLTAKLGKLWKSGVRRLVLDEVSMLAGDQLTFLVRAIDEVNGRGYVLGKSTPDDDDPPQMGLTLVGDFAQLSPVKASYAFESPEWERFAPNVITLDRIYRQDDQDFIAVLRAARHGRGRVVAEYFASRNAINHETDDHYDGPTIVAKNESVDRFNYLRMSQLQGKELKFTSHRWGKLRSEWGQLEKPEAQWGIPKVLPLKIGALVMILANRRTELLPRRLLYVNGDLGTIVDATEATCWVELQRTGEVVEVEPVTRDVKVPCDSARRKELREKGPEGATRIDGKWEVVGSITYLPLRVAYASTVHKCVAPDTRVLVAGRGAVRVCDLRVGEWIDTGGGLARLKAVAQTECRLHRLTTARGYTLLCSPDHRWKTPHGFRQTCKLVPDHPICLTTTATITGTQEIDSDLAWWIGASLGNAAWADQREGQIHFTSEVAHLRERWMAIAQRLGGRPNTRRDERGCHLTSLPLRLRLAAWGCDYVTAVDKRVPEAIWTSGPSAWAACLQGLFDTDGSMIDRRLVYATRSEGLACDVQQLLLYLGIASTRGTYAGPTGPYQHVWINAEQRDRYEALVGFSHPEKQRALGEWHPNRVIKHFDGTDTVKTIECLKVIVPMFDIELETIHELGFGPFVGSNSQGLSLDRVQVNIRDPFFKSPGMLYVALSRARSAAGLRLVGSPQALVERCVTDPRLRAWL